MPHYLDGTPAEVGDDVIGRGYNESKDQDIIGTVIDVRQGDACTLTVAYAKILPILDADMDAAVKSLRPGDSIIGRFHLSLGIEYGDTKGFRKVT